MPGRFHSSPSSLNLQCQTLWQPWLSHFPTTSSGARTSMSKRLPSRPSRPGTRMETMNRGVSEGYFQTCLTMLGETNWPTLRTDRDAPCVGGQKKTTHETVPIAGANEAYKRVCRSHCQ